VHTNRGGEESVVHLRQKESLVEITKGKGGGRRSKRRSTGGRGRDAGRRPLQFDRGSRIYPIVEAIIDRPRQIRTLRYDRSRSRSKIRLEQIVCRTVPFLRDCSTIARRAALLDNSCRLTKYIVILRHSRYNRYSQRYPEIARSLRSVH